MKSRIFNRKEIDFIIERYKEVEKPTLVEMLNQEFGKSFTLNQLYVFYRTNKLKSGINKKFYKGHQPWQVGTKGLVKPNVGSFKKGNKPHNVRPLGYELKTPDGYLFVKVSYSGGRYDQWKLKHRLLWEEHYGDIPEGMYVIFLDGNKENIVIENLMLIDKRDALTMNHEKLFYKYPELTRVGTTLAKIKREVNDYERYK